MRRFARRTGEGFPATLIRGEAVWGADFRLTSPLGVSPPSAGNCIASLPERFLNWIA